MRIGITCPKCGLMQLASPRCKSCGAPLPSPGQPFPPRDPNPASTRQGAETPDDAAPPGRGTHHATRFAGSGWTLLGISIVNWLLTFLTLGLFSFWAKTRTRRYLIGQTEFDAVEVERPEEATEHVADLARGAVETGQ